MKRSTSHLVENNKSSRKENVTYSTQSTEGSRSQHIMERQPRKKKKIILTSFINVGPYKSAEEIRREEEKA